MQNTTSKRSLKDELRVQGKASTHAPRCSLKTVCETCRGRGFSVGPVAAFTVAKLCRCVQECQLCFGAARYESHGKATSCREPSPRRIVNVVNEVRLPARYAEAAFDKFSNFSGNGRDIVNRLTNYNPTARKGFLLSGPVGIGKTYLLAAVAKNLAFQGVAVRFVDFFQLLSELRAAYADKESDLSVLAPLIDVDLLVIDELGKGRNNEWELTVLDQLVMGRYNQHKPIIASTNCSLKAKRTLQTTYNIDLERDLQRHGNFAPDQGETLEQRVGQRIFSRLIEMCDFVEMTGTDFRKT